MSAEHYEDLMRPLADRYALAAEAAAAREDVEAVNERPTAISPSLVIQVHETETAQLRQEILAHVHVHSHEFFERLIIDVLLRMGYGTRHRDLAKCLGRSHDGGVDGVIALDELGLDMVYIQAKRLKPGASVPLAQVRDFAGSLESKRASKGLFVTTAQFTTSAHEFVASVSRRVGLVDGTQLADIMIRHNIGVRVKETFQFKELELSYFKALAAAVSPSARR